MIYWSDTIKPEKGVVMLDILLELVNFEMKSLSPYTLIWHKQGSQEVHVLISRFLYLVNLVGI